MTHPYLSMGESAFWKSAVADKETSDLSGLWQPKFRIRPGDSIITAGSCFAQHIGRALHGRGYGWVDAEPAPPYVLGADARALNYGIFTFRTGNIYTPRMLNQWLGLAFGGFDSDEVWQRDGRVYDPLRPLIEPNGFASHDELFAARAATCAAMRDTLARADLFVFTLGLTESWQNTETGLEYAMCPGTVAGEFDAAQHRFSNANMRVVFRELDRALRTLRRHNKNIRVLLTVSPVPLTATASGKHVMTATTYSKSVLRAVAGQMAEEVKWVDYFPSYEIITSPVFGGQYYAPNQRSVEPQGVDRVMAQFFADQEAAFGANKPQNRRVPNQGGAISATDDDVKCEEELLGAFAA